MNFMTKSLRSKCRILFQIVKDPMFWYAFDQECIQHELVGGGCAVPAQMTICGVLELC